MQPMLDDGGASILIYLIAFILWLAILAGSYPYVRRHHHRDQDLLAAYLIFVTVFSAAAFFFFAVLTRIPLLFGRSDVLEGSPALLFLALLALVPAFYLARWQIRKPGMNRPGPPPD